MESRSGLSKDQIIRIFREKYNDIDLPNISPFVMDMFRTQHPDEPSLLNNLVHHLALHCDTDQIKTLQRQLSIAFQGADVERARNIENIIHQFIADDAPDKDRRLIDTFNEFIASLNLNQEAQEQRKTLKDNLREEWSTTTSITLINQLKPPMSDIETGISIPLTALYTRIMTHHLGNTAIPDALVKEFHTQLLQLASTLASQVTLLTRNLNNSKAFTKSDLHAEWQNPASILKGTLDVKYENNKFILEYEKLIIKFDALQKKISELKFGLFKKNEKESLLGQIKQLITDVETLGRNFNLTVNSSMRQNAAPKLQEARQPSTSTSTTTRYLDQELKSARPKLAAQPSRRDVTNPQSSAPITQVTLTQKKTATQLPAPKTSHPSINQDGPHPSPTRQRSLAAADEIEARFIRERRDAAGNPAEAAWDPTKAPQSSSSISEDEAPQSHRPGRSSSSSE